MRILLGGLFVIVGLVWGWRVSRAFAKGPRGGGIGMSFEFLSGYAIDLVLIAALECLGLLLIFGH